MYWLHQYWGKFLNIKGVNPATDIKDVPIQKAKEGDVPKIAQIFTLDGKPQNELQKGINIVKYSDGATKKIMLK